MSARWTPEMDAELTRRRAEGQTFAKIAIGMRLPKNAAIARAKRLGLVYELKPVKHTARKTYAQKRVQNIVTHEKPEPPVPPLYRSPVQDAWPLTMCAELPLSLDHWYEPVN